MSTTPTSTIGQADPKDTYTMVVGVVEDAVMVRPPLRDCVEYCGFTLLGEVAVASFGSSLPVHRPHRFRQCSRKFIFASRKCVWSH